MMFVYLDYTTASLQQVAAKGDELLLCQLVSLGNNS